MIKALEFDELITKKEIKFSLANYSFACRKIKSRYRQEVYNKTYIFDVDKKIYDTFQDYNINFYDAKINIQSTNNGCTNNIFAKFTTRQDLKSKKIIPVVKITKTIEPLPGMILTQSKEEAAELFNLLIEHLSSCYIEIQNKKFDNDYKIVRNIITKMSDKLIVSNHNVEILLKKLKKIEEEQSALRLKIMDAKQAIVRRKTYSVCKSIKENNFTIPEEVVEEFLCNVKYFDKRAIINAVVEIMTSYETEFGDFDDDKIEEPEVKTTEK